MDKTARISDFFTHGRQILAAFFPLPHKDPALWCGPSSRTKSLAIPQNSTPHMQKPDHCKPYLYRRNPQRYPRFHNLYNDFNGFWYTAAAFRHKVKINPFFRKPICSFPIQPPCNPHTGRDGRRTQDTAGWKYRKISLWKRLKSV